MANDNPALALEIVLADGTVKKVFKDLEEASKPAGDKAGKEFGDQFSKQSDKKFKGMFDKFKSDFTNSFSTIGIGVLAAGFVAQALGSLKSFVTGSIAAANRQEDAINSLNAALKRTGEFTEQASQDFQQFASGIQSRSVFGDELILEQAAFAKSLGLTNNQTKQVVQAAVELASALNIDLNSAVRNIAKTYSGLQGELGELLPSMKALTAEQLKAGGATQMILEQFSGAAESRIETTRGAYDQLSNSFGDLAEMIGRAFTSSQLIQGSLRGLNSAVQDILKPSNTTEAERLGAELERIRALLRLETNRGSSEAILEPLRRSLEEQKKNLQTLLIDQKASADRSEAIEREKQEALNKLSEQQRSARLKEISTIGLTELQQLEAKYENDKQLLLSANEDKLVSEQEYLTRSAELRRQFEQQEREIIEANKQDPSLTPDLSGFTQGFAQAFGSDNLSAIDNYSKRLEAFSKDVKKFGQDSRNALIGGFAGAIGNSFAAFGQALANGDNALKAFTKAFIGSIGQMAIQQGTSFILQGLGYLFVPGFQGIGGALIGAGATLAAFGGALTAFSGGSPTSPSTANSSQSYSAPSVSADNYDSRNIELEERREAGANIVVNVHGNILGSDRDSLGRTIVELINEATDFQGARLA